MSYRLAALTLVACLASNTACQLAPRVPNSSGSENAVIVGQIVTDSQSARLLQAAGGECPNIVVTINGNPVDVVFDDDCAFLIDSVQPAELVEVRVELVDLGVAGTVELSDVLEGELIEILIEPGDSSLAVVVDRRATPTSSNGLPVQIEGNNVSIKVPAGLFAQDLTVRGNRFTLVGEAGEDCADSNGWTEIDGSVLVFGNKATFRNIKFNGPVELYGNSAKFINCCFGGELLVFGNNTQIGNRGPGNRGGDKDDDKDDRDRDRGRDRDDDKDDDYDDDDDDDDDDD